MSFNGISLNIKFAIVDQDFTPILGLKSCVRFGIVQPTRAIKNSRSNKKQLWLNSINKDIDRNYILNHFSDLFSGLGCFETEYEIKLKQNAQPIAHAPRKVPQSLMKKLKLKLEEMEKNGIIMKTNEYSE